MALRLFPQLSRSLRAAPPGSRAVSRTPEQLGIFDWMTRRAQPQDVPNVSPHSSAMPSGQQVKPEGPDETAAAGAEAESAPPSRAEEASVDASSALSSSSEPAADEVPVASSSSKSPGQLSPSEASTSSAESSSSAASSSSDAPRPPFKPPVALDTSLFSSSAGVKITSASPLPPAPTLPTSPAAATSSSASVQSYSPPPPPPKAPSPPQPSADERWAAINDTRKAQLYAQNARAGNKYTGRTMHFRPGDVSRAIGQIQTIVRTNDIRTELVRNEYFEAKPLKRWRKKRQFWADYITVGVRRSSSCDPSLPISKLTACICSLADAGKRQGRQDPPRPQPAPAPMS